MLDKTAFVDTTGPKTGNLSPYKRIIIPVSKNNEVKTITGSLFLKVRNATPNPNPNGPVVKANMINSAGCKNKSSMHAAK